MRQFLFVGALLSALGAGRADADLIAVSVNFRINTNDNNSVDPGETSVVGNPSAFEYDGSLWNNVTLSSAAGGAPTFVTNTTGGNQIIWGDTSTTTGNQIIWGDSTIRGDQ